MHHAEEVQGGGIFWIGVQNCLVYAGSVGIAAGLMQRVGGRHVDSGKVRSGERIDRGCALRILRTQLRIALVFRRSPRIHRGSLTQLRS